MWVGGWLGGWVAGCVTRSGLLGAAAKFQPQGDGWPAFHGGNGSWVSNGAHHFADTPSPTLLRHLLKEEGDAENGSLADGALITPSTQHGPAALFVASLQVPPHTGHKPQETQHTHSMVVYFTTHTRTHTHTDTDTHTHTQTTRRQAQHKHG